MNGASDYTFNELMRAAGDALFKASAGSDAQAQAVAGLAWAVMALAEATWEAAGGA